MDFHFSCSFFFLSLYLQFDVAFCSSMVLFLTVFSISPTLELLRNSRFWKFGEIMSYSVRLELPGSLF